MEFLRIYGMFALVMVSVDCTREVTRDDIPLYRDDSCTGCREAIARLEERSARLEHKVAVLENKTCTCNHVSQAEHSTPTFYNARDCEELYREGVGYLTSGVYNLTVNGNVVEVYCDFRDDGNWLVFQRRSDGSVDFYRDWLEYQNGFGDRNNEFWLGLETLHQITSGGNYQLRIDLEDWDNLHAYSKYSSFSIGPSRDNYRITVSGLTPDSTAGDSIINAHNTEQFSTLDKDHDRSDANCAVQLHGGWWFDNCLQSNLNGEYLRGGQHATRGVVWTAWKHNWYSMKGAEMKIRPSM